ncbi:hypothetical protein PAE4_10914 [Bacillus altitudinis]|nr:hypothetical protein PAE4_10914 [Bacillus altitudinis]VXB93617.1 hypothetical protein BACI9J_60187 [Bacillus altitudinis]
MPCSEKNSSIPFKIPAWVKKSVVIPTVKIEKAELNSKIEISGKYPVKYVFFINRSFLISSFLLWLT